MCLHPMQKRNQLLKQLGEADYVTIMTDASNHGSTKLLPIMVRFFDPYDGINLKIIDFQSKPGETSDIIDDFIIEVS